MRGVSIYFYQKSRSPWRATFFKLIQNSVKLRYFKQFDVKRQIVSGQDMRTQQIEARQAKEALVEKATAEKAAAEKAAAEKAAEIKKAAAQKSEVSVSYESAPAASTPKKPSDPVDNTIKLMAAGLAFLILLVVSVLIAAATGGALALPG